MAPLIEEVLAKTFEARASACPRDEARKAVLNVHTCAGSHASLGRPPRRAELEEERLVFMDGEAAPAAFGA